MCVCFLKNVQVTEIKIESKVESCDKNNKYRTNFGVNGGNLFLSKNKKENSLSFNPYFFDEMMGA